MISTTAAGRVEGYCRSGGAEGDKRAEFVVAVGFWGGFGGCGRVVRCAVRGTEGDVSRVAVKGSRGARVSVAGVSSVGTKNELGL